MQVEQSTFQIFNASAGSGKTYTLVKEYLKLVLRSKNEQRFRNILAITFTNKAVNEMKQRILKNLFLFAYLPQAATSNPLFQELCADLGCSPEELKSRSQLALKRILHNYAFFDVSTIDKFTHRLIRTFARDLKLPQNFEVILEEALLLEEAVGRLISKAGKDPELTRLLLHFALQKVEEDKSWDISLDLNRVGTLLFDENHLRHLSKLKNKDLASFLELQKLLKSLIKKDASVIASEAQKAMQIITDHGLAFTDFKSSYFPKFLDGILRGNLNLDFKASWKINFGTEPLYNKSAPQDIKELQDSLLAQFATAFENIKIHYFQYALHINALNNIIPLTILSAIQEEIKFLQQEKGLLPISTFNTIIAEEIKDQPAPYIYERLGEKYQHYFIDEFQDTSEMQWENLVPLIGNALEGQDEAGQKGSLLLVGDTKQAIYRWRGGKAEQFLDLLNFRDNAFVLSPEIQELPKNYRSHAEIINFNNDFFRLTGPLMSTPKYNQLFEKGSQQKFNDKDLGLVSIEFLSSPKEELDANYGKSVLNKIKEVQDAGYQLKDICILTRKRKQGIALAEFLMMEEIPIISSETLLLKANKKVNFLINLLWLSQQPSDKNYAFEVLHFLKGDDEEFNSLVLEYLEDISSFMEEKYQFKIARLNHLSVFDGLEYAIRIFQLAPTSDAYLIFLLDEVLQVESLSDVSITSFLAHWEKRKSALSIVAPEDLDAVKIMTIHKAKGLEFPVVIFPYANTYIYEERFPKLWYPVKADDYCGFEELLLSKKKELANYGELAETLYEEEQGKLELDAYNLLYVALTRSVAALYIISEFQAGSKKYDERYYSGLFIHYLKETGQWNDQQLIYSRGSLPGPEKRESTLTKPQETIPFSYSYKERLKTKLITRAEGFIAQEREQAIAWGTLFHDLMSLILVEADLPLALEEFVSQHMLSAEEKRNLNNTCSELMLHPLLNKFYQAGVTVRNEAEIITENGLILRPDRLVIDGRQVTIIDYKTGKKDIKHKDQLEAYAAALKEMGYEVSAKIIVYVDQNINPLFID